MQASETSPLIVPVNTAKVMNVLEWPTLNDGTLILEVRDAVLFAYAGSDYRRYALGAEEQVFLQVHAGPSIDTSPVKRPSSFMQMYRMAWRSADDSRMARDGWNMTVPEIVGWGDVVGLTSFGVAVSIHGIQFDVQMEEAARHEFDQARRYAFRGELHVIAAA